MSKNTNTLTKDECYFLLDKYRSKYGTIEDENKEDENKEDENKEGEKLSTGLKIVIAIVIYIIIVSLVIFVEYKYKTKTFKNMGFLGDDYNLFSLYLHGIWLIPYFLVVVFIWVIMALVEDRDTRRL